ncbi:MAG: hypothetical protein IKZ89_07785 [Bacteroidaceae bacterium]|nr:hypothetical protein [Bacteroidaceae bacterium]
MKQISLFAVLVAFVGCQSDFFFDDSNDYYESVNYNLTENMVQRDIKEKKDVFDLLNIELVSYTNYDSLSELSLSSFFNNSNRYLAYQNDTEHPILITYDCLSKDTSLIHFNYSYLSNYVKELLDSIDKYTVNEVRWRQGTDEFSTIAIIDKKDGIVLYDNILFNIFSTPINNKTKKYLHRGENDIFIKYEESFFNNDTKYTAEVMFRIAGHFDNIQVIENGTTINKRVYVYDNECLEWAHLSPNNSNGISPKAHISRAGSSYSNSYGKYNIGVGVGFSNYSLPTIYNDTVTLLYTSYGHGYSFGYKRY